MDEVEQLQRAIVALEEQRGVLGDAVVETALAPLRQKLADLRQPSRPAVEQRKLVTILFADLAGFTALSERLDPEDMREILNDYFQRWSSAIQRHSGQVEKFIGDAVMAVFGMLTAREDDPESAILAALEMRQELAGLNQELRERQGEELAMRVGVHTGPVVVSTLGERAGQEFVVVGDAVNLASRLQAAAPAGGILISQDTYRQVRGVFEVEPIEPLQVKGKQQPVQAYLLVGEKLRAQRLHVRGAQGILSPLVGRERELESLQAAFQAAASQSRTHIVTIIGEAGMGKSRLVEELNEWLETGADEIPLVFRARSTRSMQQIPYALMKAFFSDQFDIRDGDPAELARVKLEEGLMPFLTPDAQSKAHFIGSLAGFDLADSPHLVGVKNDALQFRDRALHYTLQFFDALLDRMPTVMILDDIHWADEPSLQTILGIAEQFPNRRLLILCLAQPQFLEKGTHWESLVKATGAECVQYSLLPLTQAQSQKLLEQILKGASGLPGALFDQIAINAEGNPFYLEELVQMLIDDGTIVPPGATGSWEFGPAARGELRIPSTLTAVLQARLDSLPASEKTTLQEASVAGRVFWDSLLQAMAQSEESPTAELDALCQRDLVLRQVPSSFEDTLEYQFKHASLRDVTYETLLKSQRRRYHVSTAAWLETMARLSQREAEFQALIAEHYGRGGENLRAADAYLLAGERAREIGASQQADLFFEKASALIPPSDLERRWRLRLGWGEVLSILGDPEKRRAGLEELLVLAQQMDQDRRAEAFYRYGFFLDSIGEAGQAAQAFNQALESARQAGNELLQAMVLALLAIQQARHGQLDLALKNADQARACLAADGSPDPGRAAMVFLNLSITYMAGGDFEQAYQINRKQVELSHQWGNLRAEAYALNNMGYCLLQVGQFAEARSNFEASMGISQSIGDRMAAAYAGLNLGLALWRGNHLPEAGQALEPAKTELERLGDTFGTAAGWLYQGLVEESGGNPQEAQIAFGEAAHRLEGLSMAGSAADARAGLARAALQMDGLPVAAQEAEVVQARLMQQGGAGMEFPILGFLTCARIAEAQGEAEAAASLTGAGHENLIKQADRINDPAWRKTYLEGFPEHQALLERWAALNEEISL